VVGALLTGTLESRIENVMKTSTKLITTAAASVLGVVLAAGGAYAATGTLTSADAPGQVLKVSGVGPASAHASATALAHANANAKGLFGTDTAAPEADATAAPEADVTAPDEQTDVNVNPGSEQAAVSSANTAAPVAPSVASQDASTVKGSETGKEISAWAHAKAEVETVAPDAAVSIDGKASVPPGR
jgi:hypothetical protein